VVGGGSLVTITDSGTGMTEEELALFNWQLDNPAPTDMAVARRMGLFAVALLAARHGITVTLSKPLDGGTTAEVYLPAALISLGAAPGRRQGRADEASPTQVSEEASGVVSDQSFSPLRLASGPEPSLGPEVDEPEPALAVLGAPVPAPAPAAETDVTAPEPVESEPGDGLPIFESVRSGYLHAFGRDLPPSSEQQAGQSPADEEQAAQSPAEQPARPPASWGDGNGHAEAPAATPPPASGLPQRVPEPGQVHGAATDQETQAAQETQADQEIQHASVTESAESTRSKLASFQRGSRRARATAQMNRGAQPGQDG